MGEVVRVHGVERAGEVGDARRALDDAAEQVGGREVQVVEAVAELLGVRGLGRGGVPGGLDGGAEILGDLVALLAGVVELVLRGRGHRLARIVVVVSRPGRQVVLLRLVGVVVFLDELVVGGAGGLGGLLGLVVVLQGLLGLALRPFDGLGEAAHGVGGLLEGGGGLEPARRLLHDGIAERPGGFALEPVGPGEALQAVADGFEGLPEVVEVGDLLADLRRAAVDQLLRVLGLAEFEFLHVRAEPVGRRAALLPDPVTRVVEADFLRQVGRLVAGPLDGVADPLDGVLGDVLDRVGYVVAPAHQLPPPSPFA